MTTVTALKVLGTNFTYLHRCGDGQAFAVDPGDAAALWETLGREHLTLTAVLVTHHHWDHVAGAADLQAKTRCAIVGVGHTLVPAPDRVASEGDVLTVGDVSVQVLATPGHTRDSVCYYVPAQAGAPGVLYTGDTLFVGGCGRVLEGDPPVLWDSLQRLAALPPDTLVYGGHDYALENYEFAVRVAPTHRRFRERLEEIQKTLEYGQLTVPSTIVQERTTNIFLLADQPQIKAALDLPDAAPAQVFTELRSRKDVFG